MLILTSWLKDFVSFHCTVEKLAHDLTMAGLEVEGVESAHAGIENVIAARITDAVELEGKSGLRACTLDAGGKTTTVVCGAPNVETGRIAVLAQPGTVLPDGSVIKKSVVHGVESDGMLCSEAELALGDDRSGIMYLEDGIEPGTPLVDALGLEDWVLEIGITPNRSDCLSHLGVAREVSAAYELKLHPPCQVEDTTGGSGLHPEKVSITIEDSTLCGRYAGAIISGIKVGPSPAWMAARLAACGIRPINNIVDVTNYVLLETGQPLHAFDLERLKGGKIIVRPARKGEKITTLDGKERELQEGMLAICDESSPVAVAGVMGGADSEVTDETVNVLLESAWFNPSSIRRTAKTLKLSTEASYRFERGVDPENTVNAMLRAAQLIQLVAGGTLTAWKDECPAEFTRPVITLRPERAASLIGADIPAEKMAAYLSSIGIQVSSEDGRLKAEVPLYRPDISEEIDLVEEIARLHGFDSIPTTWPVASIITRELESSRAIETKIRSALVTSGMNEIISYSFTSPKDITALGFAKGDRHLSMVKVQNPLSEDQSVMRTSIVPCLLRTASRNHARRNLDLRLFETGTVFFATENEKQPVEEKRVAALFTGRRMPAGWAWDDAQCDFFDMKGVLEALLESLRIAAVMKPGTPDAPFYLPGASLTVGAGGDVIGTAGQVNPVVLKAFDISTPVYLFDLSLEGLARHSTDRKEFQRLAKFPAVELDIAIVVQDQVRASEIMNSITESAPSILEKTDIFDVYSGKPIPKGQKSIAIRFTYRAPDHTLSDEEVNAVHSPLVDRLLEEFKAELRK